jgi:hypothetical protein
VDSQARPSGGGRVAARLRAPRSAGDFAHEQPTRLLRLSIWPTVWPCRSAGSLRTLKGSHVEANASCFHGCVYCLSRGMRVKQYGAAIRLSFSDPYGGSANTHPSNDRRDRCHHRHRHRCQQYSDRRSHRQLLARQCGHRQQRELPPCRAGGRHLRRHFLGCRAQAPNMGCHSERGKRDQERSAFLTVGATESCALTRRRLPPVAGGASA